MENNKRILYIDVMLTIILIALKLDNIIDWKWILVISPIWGSWVVIIAANVIINLIEKCAKLRYKPRYEPMTTGIPTYWDYKTKRIYGNFNVKESDDVHL